MTRSIRDSKLKLFKIHISESSFFLLHNNKGKQLLNYAYVYKINNHATPY